MPVEKDIQRVPGLPPSIVVKVQDDSVREDAAQFKHPEFEERRRLCVGDLPEALRPDIDVCEPAQSTEEELDEHLVPIRL